MMYGSIMIYDVISGLLNTFLTVNLHEQHQVEYIIIAIDQCFYVAMPHHMQV